MNNTFQYTDERFADLQLLRYRLPGFDGLTSQQKAYIYCLSQATLFGRDITFDQQGIYHLRLRKVLEAIYQHLPEDGKDKEELALEIYLKQMWFSAGIYHHYSCDKLRPGFTENFFRKQVKSLPLNELPLRKGESVASLIEELCPIMFDIHFLPKRVNQTDGEDLVITSACNFYSAVSQAQVENFYMQKRREYDKKNPNSKGQPSWGLNSRLVHTATGIEEQIWKVDGLYGAAITAIVKWLTLAIEYAENEEQKQVIHLLIEFYKTGDLSIFDQYSQKWVAQKDGLVDFVNGFIEVYGDPLGIKGTWEGIVEYKDMEATRRTQLISEQAQWFEDHSPVSPQFRKEKVKGVIAHVVCAAMLGGEEYPASAIGINLPNANWIRTLYGSKSVTIGNLTEAYNEASKGSRFYDEFISADDIRQQVKEYGSLCDDLHTDLHECLGHGSGRLLPTTDPNALKAYGNTIEEARADLFGLYFLADTKLVELGLLPKEDIFHCHYYTYMLNGLLTQTVRIQRGGQIEEAHMRNRALIAWWALDLAKKHKTSPLQSACVELIDVDGKHDVRINDYQALRCLFAFELAEIQRIKSEGDYEAARNLIEKYAVQIDTNLHEEVLQRYATLNIAPYKGFINPWMKPIYNDEGRIIDVKLDYTESFAHQNLRYSRDYSTLI